MRHLNILSVTIYCYGTLLLGPITDWSVSICHMPVCLGNEKMEEAEDYLIYCLERQKVTW